MQEKIINSMDDSTLSPIDLITLMFERTDEDGVLYIPSFIESGEDYRCRVDWNLEKYENLLEEFKQHYEKIKQIALVAQNLDGSSENAKKILKNDELVNFWDTYIRRFDIGDIDFQKVLDISDRLETKESVRNIAETVVGGKELDDNDRRFLVEYIDIKVTDEEQRYYDNYVETVYKDAEKRLGKKQFSYKFILHSMRLCRLLDLGAPEYIVKNEAMAVAVSMLLYKHGISRESVDNTRRLQLERMELMSDEELDELYRPKKTNSRKSMAPLFVYSILKEKSSSKKHLRQREILLELEKYPYELAIERKALSRIIHNLTDSPQYAVFQDKSGVWIEQKH